MEHSQLLGTTFNCSCGKKHTVPTEELVYGKNAYNALLQRLLSGTIQNALIIADIRTYAAAGRLVENLLLKGGIAVSHFIVPDRDGESPVADDATKDLLLESILPADIYIAVGSGVINDLVKWTAYLNKKPFITVPTAASMNGYASANVAATVDGLKVLFHAEACRAVYVDSRILHEAPYEMTASGLGDVLAKSVSSADWKLNHFLFDDYFCQFSVDLLKDLEPVYLDNPQQIRKLEPNAVKALFEALFYSSIAMTITGTSSPASGAEHLISHTLDMVADRDGRKHDLHGRQVGVASILMAALYERIMNIEKPQFREPPATIDTAFWGTLAPVVAGEYQKKQDKLAKAANFLANETNWKKLQEHIKPGLVAATRLKSCLAQAKAAHSFSGIRDDGQPLQREKFRAVVVNAHQMRERFTILDVAVMLGIIPDEIDQLIEKWVSDI